MRNNGNNYFINVERFMEKALWKAHNYYSVFFILSSDPPTTRATIKQTTI